MIDRPKQWTAKRIFGIDLSKRTFQGCILYQEQEYAKAHHINGEMTPEGREKFIATLEEGDWVAIEGGTSSATFARAILKNSKAQVFMLNPGKLQIVFRSSCKTDKKDAVLLAEYLRDTHPLKWVLIPIPTDEESERRALVNNQIYMKEVKVQHINRLHALFNQNGYPNIKKSDLADADRRLDLINYYFPQDSAFWSIANMINDQINLVELALESIEEKIKEDIILANPELSLPLLSLPGIGVLTAAAYIAYIGDGERFAGPPQVRNYVKLIPKKDQSGDADKQLPILSCGCKPVRRNIVQAAWATSLINRDNPISQMWVDMAPKNKRKIAVAVANKLLSISWVLINRCELYNGFGDYEYLERKLRMNKLTAIDTSMFPDFAL